MLVPTFTMPKKKTLKRKFISWNVNSEVVQMETALNAVAHTFPKNCAA